MQDLIWLDSSWLSTEEEDDEGGNDDENEISHHVLTQKTITVGNKIQASMTDCHWQ